MLSTVLQCLLWRVRMKYFRQSIRSKLDRLAVLFAAVFVWCFDGRVLKFM